MAEKRRYGKRGRRQVKHWRLFEWVTLLFAVMLVGCAFAGKISPVSFFPAPFMTLAFMPMLLVALLFLLVAAMRRRWLAVMTLIVAMLTVLPVFSIYVPLNNQENLPPMPVDRKQVLKVMTYNVLSFNYNEASNGQSQPSIELILDAKPDVVLLQEGGAAGIKWTEIPSVKTFIAQIKARYPYTYNSPEGLNIISRYPFTTRVLSEPRYTRSVLGYNRDNKAYLARAYYIQLPSGKQLRFIDFRLQSYHLSFGKNPSIRISPDVKPAPLERMRRSNVLRTGDAETIRRAIDNSPRNVIVCGDMNDVPSSHVYRVIRGDDMTDAWKEVGNGYAYTFNRHHLPFRIDHVLYRGDLQAVEAHRLMGGSSDHYPLMVTFDIGVTEPHPTEN